MSKVNLNLNLKSPQGAVPRVGQRIVVGEGKTAKSGVVTSLGQRVHPKFGTAVCMDWDSGRPGAFFSNVSPWSVI